MNIGTHHLQTRRQIYKKLEPYPHPNAFKRYFDYLMYVVGLLGPLALFPQVIEVFSSHSVAGLSLLTWVLLACINVMWLFYGVLHRAYPIVVANMGMAVLNVSIVIGILMYR